MKLEDVKLEMRVSYNTHGGKIYGSVKGFNSEFVIVQWDRDFTPTTTYAEYLEPYDEEFTTPLHKADTTLTSSVKADGASADYYKVPVKLPLALFDADGNKVESVTFEMQNIIYAVVGGEWTLGNIMKACRRAWLAMCNVGKAGTDVAYDARKIIWMGTDLLNRFGK